MKHNKIDWYKDTDSIPSKNKELYKLFKIKKGNYEWKPVKGERIGQYEKRGLYNIFFELCEAAYIDTLKNLPVSERFKEIVKLFNEKLAVYSKLDIDSPKHIRIDNYIFNDIECSITSRLFDGLFLSKEQIVKADNLLKNFIISYKAITDNNLPNEKKYFRIEDAEKYLDDYLELCRFVFQEECLYQEELRSLSILENILNIYYNNKNQCFGLYSPYVVFSVLRTLKYIAVLPEQRIDNDLSNNCYETLDERKHILSTHAIRAFSRFTIIGGKSYVVDYSRRGDCILCSDAEMVSSVENVKPIRLFEKITSHIYNYFKNNCIRHNTPLTVSIFGFCSLNNSEPVEVEDLIYEIFSWFEDVKSSDSYLADCTLDKLRIDYFLIKKDKNDNVIETNYIYKYFERQYTSNVSTCFLNIYEQQSLKYNNKFLKGIFDKSDMVFVLDCPWLATEDFHLSTEGDLEFYAKWVNQVSYRGDLEPSTNELLQNKFFDRSYLLESINVQLNRMAVDNIAKYGNIVRVIKDYLLKWIQDLMEEYKEKKEYKTIYIYNSSLRGLSFSYYADYPIIREESYSNKRFSIMRFSTRPLQSIELKLDKPIYISLWNFIKYVDISFAYVGIKEYFSEHFFRFIDETNNDNEQQEIISRDIISVMRNIIFVVDYSSMLNANKIKIKIRLNDPVLDKYKNYIQYQNIGVHSDATDEIVLFFKKIIKDVIFNDSRGLGDDCIRNAFEKCLYNRSKTVQDVFFLHHYEMKRKNEVLSEFSVEIDDVLYESISKEDSLIPNFDAFGNKRAYYRLFNYLDMPRYPEYAVNSVLHQVNEIYNNENGLVKTSEAHEKDILNNILKICEICNYTNSFLYKNVMNLLE